jgi:hypothetical protein
MPAQGQKETRLREACAFHAEAAELNRKEGMPGMRAGLNVRRRARSHAHVIAIVRSCNFFAANLDQ